MKDFGAMIAEYVGISGTGDMQTYRRGGVDDASLGGTHIVPGCLNPPGEGVCIEVSDCPRNRQKQMFLLASYNRFRITLDALLKPWRMGIRSGLLDAGSESTAMPAEGIAQNTALQPWPKLQWRGGRRGGDLLPC